MRTPNATQYEGLKLEPRAPDDPWETQHTMTQGYVPVGSWLARDSVAEVANRYGIELEMLMDEPSTVLVEGEAVHAAGSALDVSRFFEALYRRRT